MTDAVVLHSVPASMRDELPDHLPDDVAVRVATTPEESAELLADAEVALTGRFDDDWFDAAPDLRWVQAMSAGVDYLPLEEFAARDVAVTTASGVHAEPIGEQVLGYMLAFERGLVAAMRQQHRGVWERVGTGGELADRTVGIVGLGAIGTRVAELSRAFGMAVLGTKRDPATAPDAVDEVYGPDGLGTLLDRADYLVLACPLTEETRGLVGRPELRRMDDDAVLVNVARGEVVDQDALVRSLQYHSIGGAALDVFEEEPLPADSPLWDLSNVLLTPHNSGSTPHYGERLADLFAENLAAYADGGVDALENRVR